MEVRGSLDEEPGILPPTYRAQQEEMIAQPVQLDNGYLPVTCYSCLNRAGIVGSPAGQTRPCMCQSCCRET